MKKEYYEVDMETGKPINKYIVDDEAEETPSNYKEGWGNEMSPYKPRYDFMKGTWVDDITEGELAEKIKEANKPTSSELETRALRMAAVIATRDHVLAGDLSEEELNNLIGIYPDWAVGKKYKTDDIGVYNHKLYKVIQAHTSQIDWTPDSVPALFKLTVPDNVIAEWVQPTGSHDAYKKDDLVTFEGDTYRSLIDANTWSPTTYPQGWG